MSLGFNDGYQYSPYNGASEASGDGVMEFKRLSQNVGSNIQKISQNVASMHKMVNQLGTAQDSESLRGQLHQVQHYTNQLAKDTNLHLKDLSAILATLGGPEQRQYKVLKERLMNDFSEALKNLQATQRIAAQKEKESVMRARANSGLKGNPFGEESSRASNLIDLARYHIIRNFSPTQTQAQSQLVSLQMEEEVNLELLREREQAVRKLESDIVDVNHIFKDLATMVHEQGEIIDSIEANVESSVSRVSDGVQQLSKARNHQTAARKKMCIILVILAVVVTVLAIILSLTIN